MTTFWRRALVSDVLRSAVPDPSMARVKQETETPTPVGDPLDMTVRELLAALVARAGGSANDEWVNIRGEVYPWRRIVAAAERGECEVSRVGRRLMMRRDELDKWLAARRIGPKKIKADAGAPTKPKGEFGSVVQRALRRNGLA
jgi:hypothetical protein